MERALGVTPQAPVDNLCSGDPRRIAVSVVVGGQLGLDGFQVRVDRRVLLT